MKHQFPISRCRWNDIMSDELKAQVGRAVCETLESGMRLGIGSGSTAEAFIRALGVKVRQGLDIVGVPTSERSATMCRELDIPLTTLEETPELDLTIDGADEIDPDFNLIKGGGGALLREKIVAAASRKMFVIVDDSKLVEKLGAFGIPIEINLFGEMATRLAIKQVATRFELADELNERMQGSERFLTDGGHYIVDASFGHIHDADALNKSLLLVPGVVQHGLFIDMVNRVFIAGKDGVEILERKS
jgi:ribose 5-phosphate isomerase A